jgi:hypothetical protein
VSATPSRAANPFDEEPRIMSKIAFAATVALLAAASAPAFAADYCTGTGTPLPEEQVIGKLRELGYQKIRGLVRERGCYEAKGFDKDGNRVEVYVEPSTGKIMKVKG